VRILDVLEGSSVGLKLSSRHQNLESTKLPARIVLDSCSMKEISLYSGSWNKELGANRLFGG
jgi:hypothetical protein